MNTRDIDTMLQRLHDAQARKLAQNEHKGNWRDDDAALLLFRLYEEADELKAEIMRLTQLQRQGARALLPKQLQAVIDEAADVANFAGFIVDKLWETQAAKPEYMTAVAPTALARDLNGRIHEIPAKRPEAKDDK